MDFYFTDRQYNLLGIASTERGKFRMAGEIEAQSTTASTVALTGNVYFAKKDLNDAIAMVVGEGGNYILYQDDRGVGHFMTIKDTQVNTAGCVINFQADDAGNDLKNEIVGDYTATKAMTFAQYFNLFCADSGWKIGVNEIPANTRTLKFTSEQSSYDRMLEVANDFNVHIYYSFTIEGMTVTNRYLNVVNKLGSTTNVTLRQGTDISQIVSETSTADLHTSIKAYGATPDGSSTPLNLAGYKWTDSTGQFVLGSDGILRDTIAIRTWSRLRSNTNPTPESSHLQWVKTYDAKTQATLLQSALNDLRTYNHPAVNYTVTMARVPSELAKGDTVNIEDEAQNLYLSATVLEVDKCYSLPSSSTLTLGDFKIEHDQTSAQIKQAAKDAETAANNAQAASTVAYSAQTTANNAATTASTAQKTADSAQTTASNAATTASAAKDTATAAEANAKTYTDTQVKPVADKVAELIPAPSSGTTYPAVPVTGQQFWLVQSSAASLYQYDGSKWQAVQLDAKTLNAETFNGMTFNGVTFNGSQFISQYSGEMYDWSSDGYSTKPGSAFSRLSDVGYQVSANWYSDSLKSDVTTEGMITPAGEYIGLFAKGKYDATSDAPSQGLVSLSPVDQSLTLLTPDNVGGTLTAKMLGEMVASGTKLWSGAWAMAGTTTLTLPKKISQCLNGIVLLWGAGNANGPGASDYTMTFIPKWFAADHSGRGIDCIVGNAGKNTFGIKYIYVTDTTLKGYANNTSNEAANKVLQGVYEY